jgi:hypothetical protein
MAHPHAPHQHAEHHTAHGQPSSNRRLRCDNADGHVTARTPLNENGVSVRAWSAAVERNRIPLRYVHDGAAIIVQRAPCKCRENAGPPDERGGTINIAVGLQSELEDVGAPEGIRTPDLCLRRASPPVSQVSGVINMTWKAYRFSNRRSSRFYVSPGFLVVVCGDSVGNWIVPFRSDFYFEREFNTRVSHV